jgi:predicted O-methyltransferase YrrM
MTPSVRIAGDTSEFSDVYRATILAARPKLVVELGCYHGGTAIMMASALREIGSGRVVTVDICPYRGHPQRNFKAAGVDKWIKHVLGDSAQVGRSWKGGPVDALHIDAGDHSWEQIDKDYRAWRPHLSPGAPLLIHDATSSKYPDVHRYIEEVIRGDGYSVAYYPGVFGLAVCWKL